MERPGVEGVIEWLGSAHGGPDRLGGKAASLDRLGRMGFRIPPGFCLTTDGFRAQVAALVPGQEAGAEILEASPLVPAVEEPLARALDRLVGIVRETSEVVDPTFAVRSSAIGEDGREASYAGLHETELGVTPDGVPASVRRCWASLWSRPALAYRERRGLPLAGGAMGVVVQALVPADAAVVAFTRHPVTGRLDQLVITAVRGLGDAMVSGTVTPDTFVVDRESRTITEYTPANTGEGPAIAGAAFDELVDLILRVEAGFGAPVDSAAAIANSDWYLLQARPITT